MLQHIAIIIAAIFGFLLSVYIWYKQSRGEKLVCFIGENCDKVVNSRYANTFGIPNKILGMLYYGGIAFAYSLSLVRLMPFSIGWLLVPITGLAALFSIYLVGVQSFILKEWCEWCLASAATSIIIFILVIL